MEQKILLLAISLIGFILGYYSTEGYKTQTIRLVDILIIGPLLIYIGSLVYFTNNVSYNKILGLVTIFFGATTMSYNYRNYKKHQELENKL